jgi:CubicO group peptidase (beta-lactamase class C family)
MLVTMSRRSSLDALAAHEIVERGVAPSAVVGIARRRAGGWLVEHGAAGRTGARRADFESVFDLASITKSFVAVALARLVRRGRVRFETQLAELVSECAATPSADASLESLGSHRAGLAAHGALFSPLVERRALGRKAALLAAARAVRPECVEQRVSAGAYPVYSDLGYLLLGEALARAAGVALDELVWDEVCVPIGSKARSARHWFAENEGFVERVAPTEYAAFRGGVVRGAVHDENAWALSGHALSGHAGLFGRVSDVLDLGTALLDAASGRNAEYLETSTIERLLRERPGGTLRLGFDGKSATGSSAGPSAGPLTFGHLGFTGTSFWCDPAADTVTVLLTNRVFPSRDNLAIREARPRVHEALFAHARKLGGVGERGITD